MWFGLKAVISPVPLRAKVEIITTMKINKSYVETFYDVGTKQLPAGPIYTGAHMYESDTPVVVTAPDFAPGVGPKETRQDTLYRFRFWEHEPTGTRVTSPVLTIDQDGDWWANYSIGPGFLGLIAL